MTARMISCTVSHGRNSRRIMCSSTRRVLCKPDRVLQGAHIVVRSNQRLQLRSRFPRITLPHTKHIAFSAEDTLYCTCQADTMGVINPSKMLALHVIHCPQRIYVGVTLMGSHGVSHLVLKRYAQYLFCVISMIVLVLLIRSSMFSTKRYSYTPAVSFLPSVRLLPKCIAVDTPHMIPYTAYAKLNSRQQEIWLRERTHLCTLLTMLAAPTPLLLYNEGVSRGLYLDADNYTWLTSQCASVRSNRADFFQGLSRRTELIYSQCGYLVFGDTDDSSTPVYYSHCAFCLAPIGLLQPIYDFCCTVCDEEYTRDMYAATTRYALAAYIFPADIAICVQFALFTVYEYTPQTN